MPQDLLQKAFDPASFRALGHNLIDLLADMLIADQSGSGKVIDFVSPEDQLSYWRQYEIDNPSQFFKDLILRGIHIQHPKYIGHQIAAPSPVTALAGLVSNLLNNGMGIYEMGSAATAIEKIVIDQFCKKIGYHDGADGMLTSGGTLANLTALLAARHHTRKKYPNKKLHIIISEQAHYCIERAASTMGMSTHQLVKIPTDDSFAMSIPHLKKEFRKYHQQDNAVMAIVGSACTTATGTYDDLAAIARICSSHDVWFHVDGAHGGAAAWSDKYQSLLSGIDKADSIVIDAHKMMLTPALATAVLFKHGQHSYQTFHQKASYLWQHQEEEWFNLAKRTYETTKYMMSIKIFLLLKYNGSEILNQYVTRQYDLTKEFAAYLKNCPDFEIAHKPMANILCFRYVPEDIDPDLLNPLNSKIRQALINEGSFYIVQTTLNATIYLRVTIMNPKTVIKDLILLCDTIRQNTQIKSP